MFIAQQLRQTNIAEYLIYMWQVEDLIRANGCDLERIEAQVVSRYDGLDETKRKTLVQWYADLIGMMRDEGVTESGHLQINRNVIITLTDLHNRLLARTDHPFYHAAYYRALPYIVDLRHRSPKKDIPEVETCMEALYGLLLLRLQQKPISEDTQKAAKEISAFVSMLANYYEKDKNNELKWDE